jgi:hypothetical protein
MKERSLIANGDYQMNEEWRPVVGYEGRYEVSNLGRVKSLPKAQFKVEKILKPYINPHNGYSYICLIKDNHKVSKRIHCLVMGAFNPVNKLHGYDPDYTIDHKDGNKTNNSLSNLEWCTQLENQRRAIRNGLHKFDKTCKSVICINTGIIYKSVTDAANEAGGKTAYISRVCQGKRNHYKGHQYKYYEE